MSPARAYLPLMLAAEVTDSSLYRPVEKGSECFESLTLRQAQQKIISDNKISRSFLQPAKDWL
jgi:hypothetical protein